MQSLRNPPEPNIQHFGVEAIKDQVYKKNIRMKRYFDANRESWDKRVDVHRQSEFYSMADFKKGQTSLQHIEREALRGRVEGKSLLHLMCHFGQDSISWAREGAREVVGVDFSAEAIRLARSLKEELNMSNVRFVESNLYDLPDHLEGAFDLVYTSYGVLGWLPDLHNWAKIVDHFLKPGGLFYIVEFHPVLYLFNFENGQIEYDYFNSGEPYEEKMYGTYTDPEADIEGTYYFWAHALEEIIGSLLDHDLEMRDFREFPYSPYPCFPNMKETSHGQYVFQPTEIRLPHLFSLLLQKPQ